MAQRSWRLAQERAVAFCTFAANTLGHSWQLLRAELSHKDSSTLARDLIQLPAELSAGVLAAMSRNPNPTDKQTSREVVSTYAFPGPVPGIDRDAATTILARLVLALDLQDARRFINSLWGERPREIFTRLLDMDAIAAECLTDDNADFRAIYHDRLATVDVQGELTHGNSFMNAQKPTEAFACWARGFAKDPGHGALRGALADLHRVMHIEGFPGGATADQDRRSTLEPQKARALTILEQLCREQGLTDFVTFGSVWEGVLLSGDVEEQSGLILSGDGKVYSYWLGWDPDRTAPDGSKGYYTLGDSFGEVSREQYESDIRYFEELRRSGVVNRFG